MPAAPRRIQRAIRQSGADVVDLQETERNTEPIARGRPMSARTYVISRYSIIDPVGP